MKNLKYADSFFTYTLVKHHLLKENIITFLIWHQIIGNLSNSDSPDSIFQGNIAWSSASQWKAFKFLYNMRATYVHFIKPKNLVSHLGNLQPRRSKTEQSYMARFWIVSYSSHLWGMWFPKPVMLTSVSFYSDYFVIIS